MHTLPMFCGSTMLSHPQAGQFRGPQFIEVMMAVFAGFHRGQVSGIHANLLRKGFLGNALCLSDELISRKQSSGCKFF
jgi:hypothetical protein